MRNVTFATNEFEFKKAAEPRTTRELLNCPKLEADAFFTLFCKPVKNPVLIAIYYYKYFLDFKKIFLDFKTVDFMVIFHKR